jgi:hypothetical protein
MDAALLDLAPIFFCPTDLYIVSPLLRFLMVSLILLLQ